MNAVQTSRPTVLVFSGLDPSGGAGMSADIGAIQAIGAHPLSIVTTLTVQDNNRVFASHPVPAALIHSQAAALSARLRIDAVKIGVMGSRQNAEAIVELIAALRLSNPKMPVVLDPIHVSGHGDALSIDDMTDVWKQLLPLTTVITPNVMEADAPCGVDTGLNHAEQAQLLLARGVGHVLITGGHGAELHHVRNTHFAADEQITHWDFPRLPGEFHGSGCTLAAAIAAYLALGDDVLQALDLAQRYCHTALEQAFSIADGQLIPNRMIYKDNS